MPVKLYDQPLEMPSWMSNVQYLRNWTITDPDVLVDRIVEAVNST